MTRRLALALALPALALAGCVAPLSDVPPIKARDFADRIDATADSIDARFGPVVAGDAPASADEAASLSRKTNSLRAIADEARNAAAVQSQP